ncbi:DNA segregation ATPase FtsK/SpoIIIE, S-DNA-T family [Lishizhenia tianjinensis]|uniref:DNA segregation ATPase FtsK/SpoIIIE, S-DNA-T family n=1 Tax=Lishizhenia tianjinensis TaxID=477690 RepID=A0A1I6YMR8_9FLAO|nr:DNA translocase FtsK [Lishizhenia tianjinensis]SFT51727.1 DNA segregation ATPase FtsK/SpoIIIE, S-DNA-T family [Lishizhenia tianjinensis]
MAKGNVLKSRSTDTKEKKKKGNSSSSKGLNPFSKLSTKLDKKKSKRITGGILLLLSVYCFIAFLSYLLTWKLDQDQVMNKNLFTYMFEDLSEPTANWLGRFGAWISHLFIYKWFGLASFGFCFMFFLYSMRLLFNVSLLPLKRSTIITTVSMVWFAIFLGFFANKVSYLGGAFGYFINSWLDQNFGAFGAFLFITLLLFIAVVVLFNPDFNKIMQMIGLDEILKGRKDKEEKVQTANNVTPTDIHAVNTITDEEIEKEPEPQEVDFSEDEDEDVTEEDLNFTVKKQEEQESESTFEVDDSFEIEEPQEESSTVSAASDENEEDDEFSVEVAEEEEELSDKELNDLAEKFGDYDPKLDLSNYQLPSIDLLNAYGTGKISVDKEELEANKNKIVETLSHYKIEISKIKATIGPTVTLYEIIPAPGVRISKIKNLEDDIALSLAALGIRIIAPIPGKGTIGIEVPNSKPEMVSMRSLIASEKFQNSDAELPVVMGKTITNETYTFDLAKMPHLLVAGATGQGKSVGLNAILVSLLYKKHPAQVKFVLVDPKKVELTLYNKIERHFLAKLPGEEEPIITDTSKVVNTLNSLCIEMDDRYELLKDAQVRNIKEYNAKFIKRKLNPEKGHRYLPYIVVLIDEFADLIMTAGKEVEHPIARIAQLARAIGIHLIVATQRPSVNVITGMIKANFPARIAFRVLSKIDSRTILDGSGADQLIGKGDMLISTGSDTFRLQCGFVDTPEVEDICDFIGNQRAYPEALLLPEYEGEGSEGGSDADLDDLDANFVEAARIVVIHQQGSASLLQRKLKLGYNRAGRLVDQLEAHNIVGPFKGSKAREVMYSDEASLEEYLSTKGLL